MRYWNIAAYLLHELFSLEEDGAAIEDTHFVCEIVARVLSSHFVFYSAYWDRLTRGVSMMVKRNLGVRVDLHMSTRGVV